ncbi:hypothetical protein PSP6_130093 [Paraburkholderia tropica]|uniref:hypothetical protein n=1 Tax=Paraburkholderia tropica TaxID=92647 RepID=UPI001CAE747A|nr:hypothetical protein [Paraburkholderia tropica]CAG9192554.1 hypothetical protein PSP6_130093 [Paraburkholderia tropica]
MASPNAARAMRVMQAMREGVRAIVSLAREKIVAVVTLADLEQNLSLAANELPFTTRRRGRCLQLESNLRRNGDGRGA